MRFSPEFAAVPVVAFVRVCVCVCVCVCACASTTRAPPSSDDGTGGATDGGRGSGGAASGRTCAAVLASSWETGLLEQDLASAEAWAAFQALDTCACVDNTTSAVPGCEDLCTEQLVEHTPTNDLCAGAPPSAACKTCLAAHCSAALAACEAS
jgi:hypothetical protein